MATSPNGRPTARPTTIFVLFSVSHEGGGGEGTGGEEEFTPGGGGEGGLGGGGVALNFGAWITVVEVTSVSPACFSFVTRV
jgi:hypothetical protein